MMDRRREIAGPAPRRSRVPAGLRAARTCYDHLAGELGVALTESLLAREFLLAEAADFRLTEAGAAFFEDLGVAPADHKRRRRAFARQCMDWSERRPHLAGALGAALAGHAFERGWIARPDNYRAVAVTATGRHAFERYFSVKLPD